MCVGVVWRGSFVLPRSLVGGPRGLPQQDVYLFLDPLLVVRGVRVGGLLIHETAQIR